MFTRIHNSNELSDFTVTDLMVLLNSGMEIADGNEMLTMAKKNYVRSHHSQAISQMTNATGYKKDKWKTYYYLDGKRKEILRNTKDEIYAFLFDFYWAQETKAKTLSDVFNMLIEYKRDCLKRSEQTIKNDIRMFGYFNPILQKSSISNLTDEDIMKWVNKEFLPSKKPKESALRKQFQLLGQIFDYGIKKKCCYENPMKYLDVKEFLKYCDLSRKTDEERAFSPEELELIKKDSLSNVQNPRALMTLFAKETGIRVGELSALHKEDIKDGFIHVHRQQIKGHDEEGHQYFYEVPYTKDERTHPHNGRYVPITEECRRTIELAEQLAGDSEYLFHDKQGNMISEDTYLQYLRKHCRRLGITTTNNHAFRVAFNSRLIDLGFSSSERALILGHEVQTNENHYSVTDKRKLETLKERLK